MLATTTITNKGTVSVRCMLRFSSVYFLRCFVRNLYRQHILDLYQTKYCYIFRLFRSYRFLHCVIQMVRFTVNRYRHFDIQNTPPQQCQMRWFQLRYNISDVDTCVSNIHIFWVLAILKSSEIHLNFRVSHIINVTLITFCKRLWETGKATVFESVFFFSIESLVLECLEERNVHFENES